jgi:DNA-binding transcriptional regulator YiaG
VEVPLEMRSTQNTTPSGPELVKRIRRSLDMTQADVARTLGISVRAIQSYEQGWRSVPDAVIVQLLVLVAAFRGSALAGKPCWEMTGCAPQGRAGCPSTKTGGHLCWFVSGRLCGDARTQKKDDALPCLACPVVQTMLD